MPVNDSKNKVATQISKAEVNSLPLIRFHGDVQLVSSHEQVKAALDDLRGHDLLGFDTESRPTFKRGQNFPVSLLQLATEDKAVLFQLHALLEHLPEVYAVLADPKVRKVGVAIHDDIKKLQELCDFEPAGFEEISNISQKAGIVNTGLRNLTGILLGRRISKGAQVTNWARSELSNAQINYAATDAWISRELYMKLEGLDLTNGTGE